MKFENPFVSKSLREPVDKVYINHPKSTLKGPHYLPPKTGWSKFEVNSRVLKLFETDVSSGTCLVYPTQTIQIQRPSGENIYLQRFDFLFETELVTVNSHMFPFHVVYIREHQKTWHKHLLHTFAGRRVLVWPAFWKLALDASSPHMRWNALRGQGSTGGQVNVHHVPV